MLHLGARNLAIILYILIVTEKDILFIHLFIEDRNTKRCHIFSLIVFISFLIL